MATKKTAGAVVDYQEILRQLAEKQSKAATGLSAGSNFASIKGGQLVIGGARMQGDEAKIVVLHTMQDRAYYENDYDPDNPETPTCYAYGDVDGGAPVAPHEKAAEKQSDKCKNCEHAEWGSAKRGRGQACRQHMRLIFVASDNKTEGESEFVQIKVPPTSLKNVKGWLDHLGAQNLPTVAVETTLKVSPDPKVQVTVNLAAGKNVTPGVLGQLVPRLADAERIISEPYPEFEEEAPAKRTVKKAAKKAARRKY